MDASRPASPDSGLMLTGASSVASRRASPAIRRLPDDGPNAGRGAGQTPAAAAPPPTHPVVALSHALGVAAIAGYLAPTLPKWARALATAITVGTVIGAIRSVNDSATSRRLAKFALLALLSIGLPCLAAACAAVPALMIHDDPLFRLSVSSALNAAMAALLLPYIVLLCRIQRLLPSALLVSFGTVSTLGGVPATAAMLHASSEGLVVSGLFAVGAAHALAALALFLGLRAIRPKMNLRCFRWFSFLALAACLAAGCALAREIAAEEQPEIDLRPLLALSSVAACTAAFLLGTALYLSYEKRALAFGYSALVASKISVCRILIKMFLVSSAVCAFLYGLSGVPSPSADAAPFLPPLWHVCALLGHVAFLAAMHIALGYVRFKEPRLRECAWNVKNGMLATLAALIAVTEIAVLIAVHVLMLPSSPLVLTPLHLAGAYLAAHFTHAALTLVIDWLRPLLRPVAICPGLLLLAGSSTALLYAELTQFFPGQSHSPTIWLAISLAASTALQLLLMPIVECWKLEAAREKRDRAELTAAFRANARQIVFRKRDERARAEERRASKGTTVNKTNKKQLLKALGGCGETHPSAGQEPVVVTVQHGLDSSMEEVALEPM